MSDHDDWYVYVVRCRDDSRYTGIARADVARRVAEHNAGRGAKYTSGRRPVTLEGQAGPMSRGDALRLELRLKKLRGPMKLDALAAADAATTAPD